MDERRLDEFDLKILAEMQEDTSLSTADLAERVGLSQSPCWRRIRRLREEGYIKAEVAIVDGQKLGFPLQVFAQVKMATKTDDEIVRFVRAVNGIPEITECYSLFGENDFMLKIVAPDVKWYQNFVFSVLHKLPGVSEIQSMVAMLETKFTTAVPLKPTPVA
jgi:Lrp/AsnC family transcriptional regulator